MNKIKEETTLQDKIKEYLSENYINITNYVTEERIPYPTFAKDIAKICKSEES